VAQGVLVGILGYYIHVYTEYVSPTLVLSESVINCSKHVSKTASHKKGDGIKSIDFVKGILKLILARRPQLLRMLMASSQFNRPSQGRLS